MHRESGVKRIRGIRGLIPRRLMLPAALGTVGVAALVAVLIYVLAGDPPGDPTPDNISGGGHTEMRPELVAFSIAGDASGMIAPGVSVPIDFALTNSHDSVMTVSDLRVVVTDVSAPGADRTHPCGVADFTVDQVANDRTIILPAGATSTLSALGIPRTSWPQVGMRDRSVNQDGCKGASLSLAYTASGTVLGR